MSLEIKNLEDVRNELGAVKVRLGSLLSTLNDIEGAADEAGDDDLLNDASALEYGIELALRELGRADRHTRIGRRLQQGVEVISNRN